MQNLENILLKYIQRPRNTQENSWSIIAMYRCFNLRNRRNSNDIENRVNYPGKASLLKGPMIIRNVLFLLFVGGRRLCY